MEKMRGQTLFLTSLTLMFILLSQVSSGATFTKSTIAKELGAKVGDFHEFTAMGMNPNLALGVLTIDKNDITGKNGLVDTRYIDAYYYTKAISEGGRKAEKYKAVYKEYPHVARPSKVLIYTGKQDTTLAAQYRPSIDDPLLNGFKIDTKSLTDTRLHSYLIYLDNVVHANPASYEWDDSRASLFDIIEQTEPDSASKFTWQPQVEYIFQQNLDKNFAIKIFLKQLKLGEDYRAYADAKAALGKVVPLEYDTHAKSEFEELFLRNQLKNLQVKVTADGGITKREYESASGAPYLKAEAYNPNKKLAYMRSNRVKDAGTVTELVLNGKFSITVNGFKIVEDKKSFSYLIVYGSKAKCTPKECSFFISKTGLTKDKARGMSLATGP